MGFALCILFFDRRGTGLANEKLFFENPGEFTLDGMVNLVKGDAFRGANNEGGIGVYLQGDGSSLRADDFIYQLVDIIVRHGYCHKDSKTQRKYKIQKYRIAGGNAKVFYSEKFKWSEIRRRHAGQAHTAK